MAISSVRIELNRLGILSLLGSSDVQSMLMDKAESVASAARSHAPMVGDEPGDESLPINVVDAGSTSRARALVTADHPAALAVEAKHRLLVGSLDAAK